MRAGKVYLAYTLGGGTLLLLAVAWLQSLAGPVSFTERGVLAHIAVEHRLELQVIFVLFIAALGVKSALIPLHGWLPRAMVAPAPVSSLLHAVAVVKAGAFGIVRLVYDVYGIETASDLGMLDPLAWLAGATIVYGSLRALFQDELKKRLAYSTVSQVSYIILGTAILGPLAAAGGIVHLVHQGIMKITLFFGAGNYAETLGVHRVSEMNGVGRRMPWTTAAFTVGALGMIGVPPMAGYISKYYLQQGGVQAGLGWVSLVLAASSLLNAAYFLPIVYRAWFLPPPEKWPDEHHFGRFETEWMLLVPPLFTAAMVVLAGILAEAPFSPLAFARIIAGEEFPP
jgi:multicomponent Na+:H+ antiporter subunit D